MSLPPSLPRRAQLAQASKVASSRSNSLLEEGSRRPRFLFVPSFLLNAPPSTFFGNSFSVSLRNFTNFITILIFLPQGYESSRIRYLLFFIFRRSYENSRIAKNTCFRFPPHYGISRIAEARFLLISSTSRDFIYCATKDAKYLKVANQRLHVIK